MPDEKNLNQSKPFTNKPVEQPIMGSAFKNQLTQSSQEGGFKNFYKANKLYFALFGLGVIVIAVLAFLAFRKTPAAPPQEAKIQLTITAPEEVSSGGEEIYYVKVENQDNQKLTGMQLELAYDNGITYVSSVPNAQNLSGTLFKVPDLQNGQNATVIVKTKVAGGINDSKKITAKLHYQMGDFNLEFVKDTQFSVRLVASEVALDLVAPQQANNAQLIVYSLKFKNNSTEDIKNTRIQLTYPDGFVFASANPQPSLSNNIWDVGTLAKGAEGAIEIQGSFNSANPGEGKTVKAELQVLGAGGQYFAQSQTEASTAIGSVPLLVTQSLEQDDQTGIVNPGDTIRVVLKYQNNSTVAARGVSISANLDSKALDISSVQAQGGQVNNSTITWNASGVSNLETLAPNESGTVSFSVRVNDPATRDSSKNLSVVSRVKIQSGEYETPFPGNDLTLKISSPSELRAQLDYVTGALPPQVGKSTVYRVTLTITNSTNDFSDAVVTMFIPQGAGGYESGSASDNGAVSYDSSTGKFTWNVGSIPAHAGSFTQVKKLSFNVRLNPSSADIGRSPLLVRGITMDAKDIFTGAKVHNAAEDLNTANISGNDYQNGTVIQ